MKIELARYNYICNNKYLLLSDERQAYICVRCKIIASTDGTTDKLNRGLMQKLLLQTYTRTNHVFTIRRDGWH